MTPVRLLVVGGGRMGEALVSGLLGHGWSPADLAIAEAEPGRRDTLTGLFPGSSVLDAPVEAEGVVIAVKPHHAGGAAREVGAAGCGRVLSIAAGITTSTLEASLPAGTPVVRAMPNTPAQVGVGAAAIAAGSSATEADLAWAESVLGAVGVVVRVGESDLDAVTGLSGSGPAYVFLLTEALTEAGVSAGLDREVATTLARQTVVGAGRLLESSADSPAALREAVTSPGGTTAAGLAVLREQGLPEVVVAAVEAAAARSRELAAG